MKESRKGGSTTKKFGQRLSSGILAQGERAAALPPLPEECSLVTPRTPTSPRRPLNPSPIALNLQLTRALHPLELRQTFPQHPLTHSCSSCAPRTSSRDRLLLSAGYGQGGQCARRSWHFLQSIPIGFHCFPSRSTFSLSRKCRCARWSGCNGE